MGIDGFVTGASIGTRTFENRGAGIVAKCRSPGMIDPEFVGRRVSSRKALLQPRVLLPRFLGWDAMSQRVGKESHLEDTSIDRGGCNHRSRVIRRVCLDRHTASNSTRLASGPRTPSSECG